MGIIKAAINAVTGALADTWLEVIESSPMGKNDVIVPGQAVDQRGRSQNKKGGENLVSNGSIIHVLDNQMMILVDGGKIVDYSATPGYFKVENSSLPSMFNGQLKVSPRPHSAYSSSTSRKSEICSSAHRTPSSTSTNSMRQSFSCVCTVPSP